MARTMSRRAGWVAMMAMMAWHAPTHGRAPSPESAQAAQCIAAAAQRYQIPAKLLLAHKLVETGSRLVFGASAVRRNGSVDHCAMQVNNSAWSAELRRHGVSFEHIHDSCVCFNVAAWIMQDNFARANAMARKKGIADPVWVVHKAIHLYNPGDPKYLADVLRAYAKVHEIQSQHVQAFGDRSSLSGRPDGGGGA